MVQIISDISLGLFWIAVACAIGWAGMSAGLKWMDKDSFRRAFFSTPTSVSNKMVAIAKYRPDYLIAIFLAVAALLKLFVEFGQ